MVSTVLNGNPSAFTYTGTSAAAQSWTCKICTCGVNRRANSRAALQKKINRAALSSYGLPRSPYIPGRSKNSSHRIRNNCTRSEEHTSELQSHSDLVCRLLLEKKKHEERLPAAHAGVLARLMLVEVDSAEGRLSGLLERCRVLRDCELHPPLLYCRLGWFTPTA